MEYKQVNWLHNTNIYEVNLRQYTTEGTFTAFAKELPRLKDMGVEILWFMPIHPISELGRKGTLGSYYAIQDYTATNPEFGSLADFKALVTEAHKLGFKVIIDWVANHTGNDNVWIKQFPDFYVRDFNGNVLHPYDWDDVSKLDYDNPRLIMEMIKTMKYWITEFDIDGFRCDMAHLVKLEFWEEARTEIDAIKQCFWLAETEDVAYHKVFDVSYTWEWMHKTEDFCNGHTDMDGIHYVLNKYRDQFPADAVRAYFTSNHDENSHTGTEYYKYGDKAKALAVFSCTWNGVPLIYSGQELPNLKKLAFFEKDSIEWTGNNELHDFYKTLLHLHSSHPALRAADPEAITRVLATTVYFNILIYLRKNGDREVLVILNINRYFTIFDIQDDDLSGVFTNVFTGATHDFSQSKYFELQPGEFLVFER